MDLVNVFVSVFNAIVEFHTSVNAIKLLFADICLLFCLIWLYSGIFEKNAIALDRRMNKAFSSLVAVGCLAGVASPFINFVSKDEFAVYMDWEGQPVLQEPGSRHHFGFYNAVYFSTKEERSCKGKFLDILGNPHLTAEDCKFLSIDPNELIKHIRSLESFSANNSGGVKSNTSILLADAWDRAKLPSYVKVRSGALQSK